MRISLNLLQIGTRTFEFEFKFKLKTLSEKDHKVLEI
jgi:hypothetical protein